jgi:Flp pilus assembly protein TadD
MDSPEPTPDAPTPRRRLRLILIVVLLGLVLAAGGFAFWWHGHEQSPPDVVAPVSDDPRLTYPTPFLNVRPEVAYVGDQACAGCHPGRSESYRRHPMGRSLAAVAGPQAAEHLQPGHPASFEALGLHYTVEQRGDRLIHRESVPGPGGDDVASVEAQAGFVIGSGTRGAGYLIPDDGYLFQSAISWYPQKGAWDLSPGYREQNDHFSRPVVAECLFCHCNRVEPVENTVNRYRAPIFRGEAIGCERCHGPAELHVRKQRQKETGSGEEDHSIVNPRRLEPGLREAVCEQCHLQGQSRVLRRGRGVFDYRPGMPLSLFWTVFVFPPDAAPDNKAVGQVEQMHASRCYQASNGGLGCSSCHDAHRLPVTTERSAYYRKRCLECHRERKECSAPPAVRREKRDDCAACHMPRQSSTDVAHVAVTDHRILRDPAHEPPRPGGPRTTPDAPLAPFHGDTLPQSELRRDLALALYDLASRAPAGAARGSLSRTALPLLHEATRAAPEDVRAWEATGYALRALNQPRDALEAYERALALVPQREVALAEAATAADELGRAEEALAYWRRALAVNPHRWHYHYQLGLLLVGRGQTAEALAECAQALRLNPANAEARLLEVLCLLKQGQKEPARAAFDLLMALKPAKEAELRRWFATQVP